MPELDQSYYTVGEAARVLGYRRQTVGNLIRDGKLHAHRLSEHAQYRIPADEVRQLLENIRKKGNRYKGVRLCKEKASEGILSMAEPTDQKKPEPQSAAAPAQPAAPAQKTRVITQIRKKTPPPKASQPAKPEKPPAAAPPVATPETKPEPKKEESKHVETDNNWWF